MRYAITWTRPGVVEISDEDLTDWAVRRLALCTVSPRLTPAEVVGQFLERNPHFRQQLVASCLADEHPTGHRVGSVRPETDGPSC